jgi:nicotinamide-nucleotide amidase
MNVPLIQNSDALLHLTAWCERRNSVLNEPNIKQTRLPEHCQIIPNKSGSAVGIHHQHQRAKIYCTPGVPHELRTMMLEQIIPQLKKNQPKEQHLDVTRLQIFGMGESTLQKIIDEHITHWPENVELGFRAGKPLLEIKLTTNESYGQHNKQQYIDQLYQLFGDHIIAQVVNTPCSLAETVVKLLKNNNKSITLAESCTGGGIASMLTKVSGASSVFQAGFVTYSNSIKEQVLGVNHHTLKNYGAVSQETVIEMAQGALMNTGSDLVISVSGIAGPTGGTPEKPVGTVWISWGSKDNLQSQCLLISTPRSQFQYYVANIGLDLIRRLLISSKEIPKYIREYAR